MTGAEIRNDVRRAARVAFDDELSELLVLGGTLQGDDATAGTGAACPPWTWLRTASTPVILSSTTPCTCWLKQGQLAEPRPSTVR